jgi:hypothetical protein
MKKLILFGVCIVLAGTAMAQNTTMLNFTGFLYESDNSPGVQGFPPSDPGDILSGVGYIESVGPELNWDLGVNQITWYMTDLISTGPIDLGNGMFYVVYTAGTLDIVADAYNDPGFTDADYGIEPPNATAPSTFTDGEVYLHGEFYNFYMTYHPTLHVGSYEGYVIWTGGTQLNDLIPDPQGYTIAGTVDPYAIPVPDGYDLESVGQVIFDPIIPTEDSTWGQVKNLYR